MVRNGLRCKIKSIECTVSAISQRVVDRRESLLVDRIADLREAVAATRQTLPFEIAAIDMQGDFGERR